jgi:hypothetical protein
LLKGLSEAGSEAEETQSKFDTLFAGIEEEANRAVDSLAADLGRSRTDLRNYTSDLQQLFDAWKIGADQGLDLSLTLSQLAVDLASFSNTADSDALAAIRSGLIGESEPLRRYGVTLSETRVQAEALALGLVGVSEELTEQDKLYARVSIILKDTQAAQGDAIRTADSYANSIKAIKSEIEDLRVSAGQRLNQAILEGIEDAGGVQALKAIAQVLLGTAAEIGRVAVAGVAQLAGAAADAITKAGGPRGVLQFISGAADAAITTIDLAGLKIRAFILDTQDFLSRLGFALKSVSIFSDPLDRLKELEKQADRAAEAARVYAKDLGDAFDEAFAGGQVGGASLQMRLEFTEQRREDARLAQEELDRFRELNPQLNERLDLEARRAELLEKIAAAEAKATIEAAEQVEYDRQAVGFIGLIAQGLADSALAAAALTDESSDATANFDRLQELLNSLGKASSGGSLLGDKGGEEDAKEIESFTQALTKAKEEAGLASIAAGGLTSALFQIGEAGTSGAEALNQALASVIDTFARLIVQALIFKALSGAISFGGGGDGFNASGDLVDAGSTAGSGGDFLFNVAGSGGSGFLGGGGTGFSTNGGGGSFLGAGGGGGSSSAVTFAPTINVNVEAGGSANSDEIRELVREELVEQRDSFLDYLQYRIDRDGGLRASVARAGRN